KTFQCMTKALQGLALRASPLSRVDPMAENNYYVDVIGFNPTERLLLSSIFGLAARRDPSFAQRPGGMTRAADLYLVDGADEAAPPSRRALRQNRLCPRRRRSATRCWWSTTTPPCANSWSRSSRRTASAPTSPRPASRPWALPAPRSTPAYSST